MAGGNLSPRQKMINLMYLVFIAMIAMQMSKEVLSAFGYMNEKLTDNNRLFTENNIRKYESLEKKTGESQLYKDAYDKLTKVKDLSYPFINYLDSLKGTFLKDVEDPTKYEAMDKTSTVDEYFFVGDKLTKKGQEFLDHIAKYRDGVIGIIGEGNLADNIRRRFDTSPQKDKDGKTQAWLNNRYEGFPLISTITNLTAIQTDIKVTNAEIFNETTSGTTDEVTEINETNSKAILIPDKSAFFQGENFKGKLIIGSFNSDRKPSEVIVNGKNITTFENGAAVLDFPAGSVGERDVKGKFVFMQNGEPVEIPIETSYAVIPKPNSAVISADKMNVVYRGVPNPMTISIPGIADNKVTATAKGLKRGSGVGKYMITPGSGKEVTINVSGILPSGQKVTTSQNFRIKDIPTPNGSVRSETGYVKMPKSSLVKSSVGAMFADFDFDLTLKTTGFMLKVLGQPTVEVKNSNKMNAAAKRAISKARKGSVVTIFNIKSKLVGNANYRIKPATSVIIEIQ